MSLYSRRGAPCSSLPTETQTYWGKDVNFLTHFPSLRYTACVPLFLQSTFVLPYCDFIPFQSADTVMSDFSFLLRGPGLHFGEPLLNITSGLIVFRHSTCKNTLCSGWVISKQRDVSWAESSAVSCAWHRQSTHYPQLLQFWTCMTFIFFVAHKQLV